MADINQQEHAVKHLGFMKITLNHLAPFSFYLLVGSGIAVARKIHIVKLIIDMVEINRLGLARLRGSSCISLPVHQRIDQRRLAYVGLACKGKFRLSILRKLAGNTADGLQIYITNYHKFSFLLMPFWHKSIRMPRALPRTSRLHTQFPFPW